MQTKKTGSAKESQKSAKPTTKQESLPAQAPGKEWEQASLLGGDPRVESQAARLSDSRLPAVQRRSLARQIGRLQGNRHLSRVLAQQVNATPAGQPVVQRRALGAATHQRLGPIFFSSKGSKPTKLILNVIEELVQSPERPGRFKGFNERVEAYGLAWRHPEKIALVVQDRAGKYHTLKTDFSSKGVFKTLKLPPQPKNYKAMWWVNLPRVDQNRSAAKIQKDWTQRADQARKWYVSWKGGKVPNNFSCPHGGKHKTTLTGVRSCLETEFVALLAEALSITTSDVHIVPSGGQASSTAMVNFNIEYANKMADSGIKKLPTDKKSSTPPSTVTFGPGSFSSRSKILLKATAIHESTHVTHADLGRQWRKRWLKEKSKKEFRDWLKIQKNRRRLSQEQFDLILGQTKGGEKPTTETLAYLNGFMASYHLMPINRTRTRFGSLVGVAEHWPYAGHAIQASTTDRLKKYIRLLDAPYQKDFASYIRKMLRSPSKAAEMFLQHVAKSVLK